MADALGRAAKEIHAAQGLEETLDAIVRSARASLPGIDHVGLSRGYADGRLDTLAATDDIVRALDQIQTEVREGPCVYAMQAETVVRVEHARREQRWPRFIPRALQLGLTAQLGIRLHVDELEMAGLNLYSTSCETLDPDLEDFAELFATYASMALGRALREDQLNTALVSRRLIGQAVGITMAEFGVTDERAFRYLVRVSNERNVKLREIAEEIVRRHNTAVRDEGHEGRLG